MRPKLSLSAAAIVVVAASLAVGQPRKGGGGANWFTVQGTVVDDKGSAVPGGMVSLKDTQSKTLRMKQTGPNGQFKFTWVDARRDYEVYAVRGDAISAKVALSGPKSEAPIVLKLLPNKQ